MEKPLLIRYIESRYGRKPPTEPLCRSYDTKYFVPRDFSIAIIGGGIAGPAFARRILSLAVELGIRVNITMVSRPSCNYCGGLVTNLSLATLRGLYNYEPAPEVVLSEIHEAVLVNPHGNSSVLFDSPLASVFRTGRFGPTGLDENFRQSILAGLPEETEGMLRIIEPALATEFELPSSTRRGVVTIRHSDGPEQIEADLVVIATGLRSLESEFITALRRSTSYVLPRVMPACVTEVDLPEGGGSDLGRRMLILNGIIQDCVVALIPKQKKWITVAGLKKVLTVDDLRYIFTHPAVKDYVHIDGSEPSLPCNRICTSAVFTSPARNFYGDGWVVLGDLTGYGRVLKDGYFAALVGADLAAHTAMFHGYSGEAFARHYHASLAHLERGNPTGVILFNINMLLARSGAFNRAIIGTLSDERMHQPYGGFAHAAFRALSTGELSYRSIGLLFLAGLTYWGIRHPAEALDLRRRL